MLINSTMIEGKVWKQDIDIRLLEDSHKKLVKFPLCHESYHVQPNGTVTKESFRIDCQFIGDLTEGFFNCDQYIILRVVGRLFKSYGILCIVAEQIDKRATA